MPNTDRTIAIPADLWYELKLRVNRDLDDARANQRAPRSMKSFVVEYITAGLARPSKSNLGHTPKV
jgi:hypothetical protein